jgi:hypothetical protein
VKIGPTVIPTFLQHAMNHVQAAREDAAYMKAHGPQVMQMSAQVAALQKQVQGQQAAQQQASVAMGALRGGGPPAPVNGAPGPVAPPGLPQPGMPAGLGPSMPPMGMPPQANGSMPGP